MTILGFLIQWLALSNYVYKNEPRSQSGSTSALHDDTLAFDSNIRVQSAMARWNILRKLQNIPPAEIECYLPQICSMLIERTPSPTPQDQYLSDAYDPNLMQYFLDILVQKCERCFPFGMKTVGFLKASILPFDSVLSQVIASTAQRSREERLRSLLDSTEKTTEYGSQLNPSELTKYRTVYFNDFNFMLSSLTQIANELKRYRVADRRFHLRNAIAECNSLLRQRIARKGLSLGDMTTTYGSGEHSTSLGGIGAEGGFGARSSGDSLGSKGPRDWSGSSNSRGDSLEADAIDIPRSSPEYSFSHGRDISQPVADAPSCDHMDSVPHEENKSGEFSRVVSDISKYSLHNPLQLSSNEPVERIIRFVEAECDVLPSKDRAPYLAVVEVLQQGYDGSDSRAFFPEEDFTSSSMGTRIDSVEGPVAFNAHPSVRMAIDDVSASSGHIATAQAATTELYIPRHMTSGHAGTRSYSDGAEAGLEPRPTTLRVRGGNVGDVIKPYDSTDHFAPFESRSQAVFAATTARLGVAGDARRVAETWNGASSEMNAMHRSRSVERMYALKGNPFQSWQSKKRSIQRSSEFGHLPGWGLKAFIVKSGVDMRREVLAMQLIQIMQQVFQWEGVDIALRPYRIQSIGQRSGLIEYLEGTRSIDSIKKALSDLSAQVPPSYRCDGVYTQGMSGDSPAVGPSSSLNLESRSFEQMTTLAIPDSSTGLDPFESACPPPPPPTTYPSAGTQSASFAHGRLPAPPPAPTYASGATTAVPKVTLKSYFELTFGPSYSPGYVKAVENFVRSLAGYSLVTYVLQLKDRHNSNILIDEQGHLIHIDFGYILGESPGFNINFENAPFKLTQEYVDVMGGLNSPAFQLFEDLFCKGFFAIKKHLHLMSSVIQLHDDGSIAKPAATAFRSRIEITSEYQDVIALIKESFDSWRTKQYDWFQYKTNGISM